ncbi:SDR family oxidoreductase [Prauserella cavernicola]|uniref:SDR family oxidoreductase n=1 Tax=Prauserella cavernicola TaxID=2800127 RepID=A0A934V6W3_9PSEU|nr:SDR family oxidoreductase [Prauserella cavernicola]MBK1787104.1 SDR family oxidoreductase [Prauserella cavernicola]
MGRLAGKVAFITGAGKEQGRQHAVRLAEEGADIIATDPQAEELHETARLVRAAGRRVVALDADVRSMDDVATAVDKGVAELGRLDIVLANAGITTTASVLETSVPARHDIADLDLTGAWRTVKASIPHLIDGERGGAIVITYPLATPANEDAAHRGAARAGVITLVQTLATELAQYGIRVNTVQPRATAGDVAFDDALHRLLRPELGARRSERTTRTLTRMPVATFDPDDITNAVLYLVSDDGCYVTGTTHIVDVCGPS